MVLSFRFWHSNRKYAFSSISNGRAVIEANRFANFIYEMMKFISLTLEINLKLNREIFEYFTNSKV